MSEKEERLLIMKVLQGRPWENAAKILKMKINEAIELMKILSKKLYDYYA